MGNWFEEGSASRAAGYFVPGLGSVLSIQDAVNDPSLSNVGMAGLSVLGDLGSVIGVGNIIRTGVAANKAAKLAQAINKAALSNKTLSKVIDAEAKYKKAKQSLGVMSKLTNNTSKLVERQRKVNTLYNDFLKADKANNVSTAQWLRAANYNTKAATAAKRAKDAKEGLLIFMPSHLATSGYFAGQNFSKSKN